MQITFYAGAADAAGTTSRSLTSGPLTADELIALLSADSPELAAVLGRCSLLANGRNARGDDPIDATARVDILPPFAGG